MIWIWLFYTGSRATSVQASNAPPAPLSPVSPGPVTSSASVSLPCFLSDERTCVYTGFSVPTPSQLWMGKVLLSSILFYGPFHTRQSKIPLLRVNSFALTACRSCTVLPAEDAAGVFWWRPERQTQPAYYRGQQEYLDGY